MDKPTCSTCVNWQGTPRQYAAPCAVNAYPGRVTFDQTCGQHTAHAKQDQSNARGDLPAQAMKK